jgi:hypothetical protein
MERSLQHEFLVADFADPRTPFLVRVAAMHHQARVRDEVGFGAQLTALRSSLGPNPQGEALTLSLHAAVILAQAGTFDAVQSLLSMLHAARADAARDRVKMIETALRNCSQFPIAALLAQAFTFNAPPVETLSIVLARREDDLAGPAMQPLAAVEKFVADLSAFVAVAVPIAGRCFGIGPVVCHPRSRDASQRFASFIAVERPGAPPVGVPFDLGDVLNRQDARARQDVQCLLASPGRRALVVHQSHAPYEALGVYLLPFESLSEARVRALLLDIAVRGDGMDIGTVTELKVDQVGQYRLLSADGRSQLAGFRSESQRVGRCFLFHEANLLPLQTSWEFDERQIRSIAEQFKQRTSAIRATYLKPGSRDYPPWLACADGATLAWRGATRSDAWFISVKAPAGADGVAVRYPYRAPAQKWTTAEQCEILQQFITNAPAAWGVMLEMFGKAGARRARAVRAGSGETRALPVNTTVHPGTLVHFFTFSRDGKQQLEATVIPEYVFEGGCPYCYGSGHCLCQECNVDGQATCSECGGSRKVACSDCSGSGNVKCGHCNGGAKVFVGNLSYNIDDDELADAFGSVVEAKVGRDNVGNSRGIGFVLFRNAEQAREAINQMDGKELDRRTLSVRPGECRTCSGSGQWRCKRCHGSGDYRCRCGGGRVPCSTCKQRRVLPCDCGGHSRATLTAI